MSEQPQRKDPDEAARLLAWDKWLDGDTLGAIHRHDLHAYSLAQVRRILEEDPPDAIREDLRYRLDARFCWVSAHGLRHPETDAEQPFVVVQIPRRTTGKVFQAAMRAIRREVRALRAGADVDLHIMEAVEAEVAVRFVNDRGFRGFAFDAEGDVTRIDRIEAPEPAGPSP